MNAAPWLERLPASGRWGTLLAAEGPRIATWLLALALGVQAAFIVTDLAGAGRAPRVSGPARPFQPQFADVAVITNAHLFGTAAAPKQDAANAPQTSMPLVLTGIIAANDPQNGLAILGPTAQTAKVHAVGDVVGGGARLHSVYSDRVIIDRNGQLESLALPHPAGVAAPTPTTASLPTQSPVVERMRRALTEQPGLIADLLHPQVVTDADNKVKGFRVFPGRNRLAFARLGLRPGDQVIAINGTPLDDQERGQAILATLGTSSEARVTVIRNNQQLDLSLNIAQVAQEAETATGLGAAAGGAGISENAFGGAAVPGAAAGPSSSGGATVPLPGALAGPAVQVGQPFRPAPGQPYQPAPAPPYQPAPAAEPPPPPPAATPTPQPPEPAGTPDGLQ
jgi:general secretion pathway protein C